MATTPFKYQAPFPLGPDTTEYYLLTKDYVSVSEFEGTPVLKVAKEGLTAMGAGSTTARTCQQGRVRCLTYEIVYGHR